MSSSVELVPIGDCALVLGNKAVPWYWGTRLCLGTGKQGCALNVQRLASHPLATTTQAILDGYKAKLGEIHCRHFDEQGACPFGTSCFYRCEWEIYV